MPRTVVGRPRKSEGVCKSYPVSFRVTAALYERIRAAADDSGHSMSREMEFRMERSFGGEDLRAIIREELART